MAKVKQKKEKTDLLLTHYTNKDENGIYNPYKLPFKQLGMIQSAYTNLGWAEMDHSADYVELVMFGPGSEIPNPFVKNSDLYNLMLTATEVGKI